MKAFIISLIDSFLWRVRGGLRMYKDKKFPLNKLWFAIAFGIEAGLLRGWNWNFVIITALATWVSYQAYGWGEAIGCLLCGNKPYPERSDCDLIDDILDTAKITIKGKTIKLVDYPVFWGWCWLSLRGLILSFIIGLALNSIPFMFCGIAMGTIYWLGGQFNNLIDDGKYGWRWAEIFWGMALGIFLILFA